LKNATNKKDNRKNRAKNITKYSSCVKCNSYNIISCKNFYMENIVMETIQGYDNWKLESPPVRPEGKCDSCFFFNKYDCKEADNFDYDGCNYYDESRPPLKEYPDWIEDEEIEDEEV
jgi:hypothetical protein